MRFRNPFAFRPLPVTTICIVIYLALIIPLLVVHHTVPPPIASDDGNLTEAWSDLQHLTDGFHPYNSHRNDEVRSWLFEKIKTYTTRSQSSNDTESNQASISVFSDNRSNVSFVSNRTGGSTGMSVYFEGTNLIVYIRGSQDDSREWWLTEDPPKGKGGVLVNAHYDSVSTGFGATDDGIGVVTVLQLIKHFTQHQPYKGLVALLNNGEEDYLNGARAFAKHPMSKFPHSFLNLEGAGAGGRATLFRSTDTEVTKFYESSNNPFGNVVSADAFKTGVIRSETDYSFFNGFLGMRGLDVAFYEPRSRYHTEEDDTRHTSRASLNHMMRNSFATVQSMVSDKSSDFEGTSHGEQKDFAGQGSDAVWFDLFGNAFIVFKLKTLFAVSVTLLVIGPLAVIGTCAILYRIDKLYLFSNSKRSRWSENSEPVGLKGLRGLTRWPISFVLASAAIVGLVFVIFILNPYIVYSSPYAVWSMVVSAWFVVAYICMSIADYIRPTALQRVYTLLWMLLANWIVLILATISEQQQQIASGYVFAFNFCCMFLATFVSITELFRLPKRSDYADDHIGPQAQQTNPESESLSNPQPHQAPEEEQPIQAAEEGENDAEEANERTSLLHGAGRTTFKRYSSPHQRGDDVTTQEPSVEEIKQRRKVYGFEQGWSADLPSSLWLLEFLLIAAFPVVVFGQVGLLFTSATSQTLADGNNPFSLYLAIVILTVLLLAPLAPFLHRFAYEFPFFLFLIFLGTFLYSIFAFPFSPANRLKLYFIQHVDLDNAVNTVSLSGVSKGPYLINAVNSLPSTNGQVPVCRPSGIRFKLKECSWPGLAPHVVPDSGIGYKDWISFNATRISSNYTTILRHQSPSLSPSKKTKTPKRVHGLFSVSAHDSRACKILFNQPIRDFHVRNSGPSDSRFPRVTASGGSNELRLWSREWNRTWYVDVWWNEDDANRDSIWLKSQRKVHMQDGREVSANAETGRFDGRVICLWSDANQLGVIPALDEVKRFAPAWTTVTKAADGLVEGSKEFVV